jgi:hypothetical protein
MSRIKSNGESKAVEQKIKAKKAFGEQIIALTHRERPYMAYFLHFLFILLVYPSLKLSLAVVHPEISSADADHAAGMGSQFHCQ